MCGSWCWEVLTTRTTTRTKLLTQLHCPQQRTGAQPRHFQMVNAEALEAPSCYLMEMYLCAGAFKEQTPPVHYSIHKPIRGRLWQRCHPSGITTRSRCSCRVGRWRWRDGTTQRLKFLIHPICTVERGP